MQAEAKISRSLVKYHGANWWLVCMRDVRHHLFTDQVKCVPCLDVTVRYTRYSMLAGVKGLVSVKS